MNDDYFTLAVNECKKADRIIIGLSGGADSVCLTHLLYSSLGSEKLICAHVNHSLRGDEAKRDEEYARNFSKSLGIEFKLLTADVRKLSKEQGIGEEECGRRVRYDFFKSLCLSENSLIATAHNADDNAETLIMNLMRGCGTKGLCGIPFKRDNIIRPILSFTREEIENYCKANKLYYVTDSTNLHDDYTRNIIRHSIISKLKELSPDFCKNTFTATRLLSKDKEHIDSETEKILIKIRKNGFYDVSDFNLYDESIKSNLVSSILSECGCSDIGSIHIESVVKAIKNNSSVSVPFKKEVNVKQNMLTVTDKDTVKLNDFTLKIGDNNLGNGKILRLSQKNIKNIEKINKLLLYNAADCDKIKGCLKAGVRNDGDKFILKKRGVTKSLKKLFNEMKIPAALRDDIVVIRDDNGIVFVEGVGVNKPYAADDGTENFITAEFLNEEINTI